MIDQTRLKTGEKIVICAFNDYSEYSVYYKTFEDIEEAIKFCRVNLKNPAVHVINIRVVRPENDKPIMEKKQYEK